VKSFPNRNTDYFITWGGGGIVLMAFPFHDKASKYKKAKGDSFPD
jgi:cytochrome oxidase assembly protein ShyY1